MGRRRPAREHLDRPEPAYDCGRIRLILRSLADPNRYTGLCPPCVVGGKSSFRQRLSDLGDLGTAADGEQDKLLVHGPNPSFGRVVRRTDLWVLPNFAKSIELSRRVVWSLANEAAIIRSRQTS